MTIYVFELTPLAMKGLPSFRRRLELCRLVCLNIFEYIHNVILWDRPHSQYELGQQKDTMVWYLDALERTLIDENPPLGAGNPLMYDSSVKVRSFYVRNRAIRLNAPHAVEFDLETLDRVPPHVLLNVMVQLINISLAGIPEAVTMPKAQAEDALRTIKWTARKATALCHLGKTGRPFRNLIRLQIEIPDFVNGVMILAD